MKLYTAKVKYLSQFGEIRKATLVDVAENTAGMMKIAEQWIQERSNKPPVGITAGPLEGPYVVVAESGSGR